MLRAGIAALCTVASCQAFHVPIASTSTSSWRAVTRQQDSFDKQALCHRRPRNSLSMAAADGVATTQKDENVAASAGTEAATSSAAAAKEGEGDPVVASAVDGDKKMSKSTKKVRVSKASSGPAQRYVMPGIKLAWVCALLPKEGSHVLCPVLGSPRCLPPADAWDGVSRTSRTLRYSLVYPCY